jgi:dTDP-4-dehydrorhamnose 3,5-epimerase
MNVQKTALAGVLLIEPRVFADARGCFFEAYREDRYAELGVSGPFVQDNISVSCRGVLRGLHLQHPYAQGKLVSVIHGEVFDVVVDVRVGSPTFGTWTGEHLSSENHRQMWIPPGFAHGFVALSDTATFCYKVTEAYHPETELTIRWDDDQIGIRWPIRDPILAPKDRVAPSLAELPSERLPRYHA